MPIALNAEVAERRTLGLGLFNASINADVASLAAVPISPNAQAASEATSSSSLKPSISTGITMLSFDSSI